jgi:hypothetical protein
MNKIMNNDELLALIKSLNNARLGSFGEHLAIDHYKNRVPHAKVRAVRRDRRDLIVEDSGKNAVRAIDVKAHKLTNTVLFADKLTPYYAKRIPGVEYEQVFFFADGAVFISSFYSRREKVVILKQWDMASLAAEYSAWRNDGCKNKSSENTFIEPAPIEDWVGYKGKTIKAEIKTWYQDSFPAAKRCRVLYRGPDNPKMFGKRDLPHNLPGKKSNVEKSSSTIFVQAERNAQGTNEIEFIVAYPNGYLKKLPLQEGSKMAKQKGYDRVLDSPLVLYSFRECVFHDVDDLMANFKARFAKYLGS